MHRILLVEDSDDDAELVMLALEQAFPDWETWLNLERARNFGEAMRVLKEERPHLVILDLNLPGRPGFDFLREIKKLKLHRHVPVVVLTNSLSEADVIAAYRAQAAAYIPKPTRLSSFVTVLSNIEAFWLRTALLPAITALGQKIELKRRE